MDNDHTPITKKDGRHIHANKQTGSNFSLEGPVIKCPCKTVFTERAITEIRQNVMPRAEKFTSPEVLSAQPPTTNNVGKSKAGLKSRPEKTMIRIEATGEAAATISVNAAELNRRAMLLAPTEIAKLRAIGTTMQANSWKVGTGTCLMDLV